MIVFSGRKRVSELTIKGAASKTKASELTVQDIEEMDKEPCEQKQAKFYGRAAAKLNQASHQANFAKILNKMFSEEKETK